MFVSVKFLKRGDLMKEKNVYDVAQRLVFDFEKKYPSLVVRMNKEQLMAAALMTTFTKNVGAP